MTFVITSACVDVMDQSCIEVCPVDCIYVEDEDRMCYIEPDECIDCAVCEAACPVGAIFRDEDLPTEVAEFQTINQMWFVDKQAAREKVECIVQRGSTIT
jgi:NAD-dependent dihydropyrimidine dehydrogenase PreA subunit